MKKDLKGFAKDKAHAAPQETLDAARAAQNALDGVPQGISPNDAQSIQNAISYYGAKSENELMDELMRYRGEGMIDDAALAGVAARIAPMLNQEQQQKLNAVLHRLKS